MTGSADQDARERLRARVREVLGALLGDDPGDVVEKRMFGGVALMVRGDLLLSAGGDGRLLVRVADERSEELQRRPGVEIGTKGGRTMGPRWLEVAADVVADDEELRFWVGEALAGQARRAGGAAR
ncbi:MAG TPA: TfoX/Sxy family protein [Actinotalea caeni]|uniref:TfoX/Sxy family protein n=1 Tax=Actinotalea caeni TaxID=1348467 RepID=UPI002B4B0FF0|nr:TfoX/Sxy family protein [Actinotalea caeni]HLV54550.1 TfoX/Sxy family protein [Actinotalea caeni]